MAHLVLCLVSGGAETKALTGLHFFLEALGVNLFPSSFRRWQNSVPCFYRTKVPISLSLSFLRHPTSLALWTPPSVFKASYSRSSPAHPSDLSDPLLSHLPSASLCHSLSPPTLLPSSSDSKGSCDYTGPTR